MLLSCSRLEYPIVTRYKEMKPIVYKEPKIREHKSHKKVNPMVRDFIIFSISSVVVGSIILK